MVESSSLYAPILASLPLSPSLFLLVLLPEAIAYFYRKEIRREKTR
jgi:hypothetical protein